jgi:hypothetical protein
MSILRASVAVLRGHDDRRAHDGEPNTDSEHRLAKDEAGRHDRRLEQHGAADEAGIQPRRELGFASRTCGIHASSLRQPRWPDEHRRRRLVRGQVGRGDV